MGANPFTPPHPDPFGTAQGRPFPSRGEGDGDKREKRELQQDYTNPLKYIQLFLNPSIPCSHRLCHRIFLLTTDNRARTAGD
jgi:hypothetical protein